MLIQRRPPCSTTSTFGSAVGWATAASPRVRVERRSRGFGRFGMAASELVVVYRRHRVTDSTCGLRKPPAPVDYLNRRDRSVSCRTRHSRTHPEGWRDMALRNPGNHRFAWPDLAMRTVPIPSGHQKSGLGDVAKPTEASVTAQAARRPIQGVGNGCGSPDVQRMWRDV